MPEKSLTFIPSLSQTERRIIRGPSYEYGEANFFAKSAKGKRRVLRLILDKADVPAAFHACESNFREIVDVSVEAHVLLQIMH